ncbi:response regulator [Brucella pituitosa]|uniref:Response regulator n=1 Tax=Brucella pituitosa TaxID=571256 RepID=A0ABS3K1T8_9HYPH|nr:response regulator [Brucella pituitosa]MBO1040882.1 response regulator [Brucella pituitosa]
MSSKCELRSPILLIDDEEPLLDVLTAALHNAGYDCLRASNAQGALKILDRTPEIDVVVSDVRMPGMDGIELMRNVRERYADRTWLQIIFITGHATLDNSIEALRLAAADFLHKPVQGIKFLASIASAARKAQNLRKEINWMRNGHDHLSRLIKEVQQLSEFLISSSPNTKSVVDSNFSIQRDPTYQPNVERFKELLRIRDVRVQFFPGKLFIDPAWHILLELMENYLAGTTITAFSLFVVSGVPTATASRRLDDMENAGLIQRTIDPLDGRRQIVSLTEAAIELMYSYLTALDQQLSTS